MIKLYIKFLSQMSTYSAANLIQNAVSFILIPLYTTYLKPVDYGVLALLNITISLLTRIASSPVNNALERYYYKPEYKNQKEVLVFNLFLFLLVKCLILCIFYFFIIDLIIEYLIKNNDLRYIVNIYVVMLILNPLEGFLLTFCRILQKVKFYIYSSLFAFLISTIVTIILLVNYDFKIFALVCGWLVRRFILSVLSLGLMIKHAKIQLKPKILIEPLKFGYPLVIQGYANTMFQSGDRFIIKMFASVSTVGLYNFANKIASITNTLIVTPLKQALLPIIFEEEQSPLKQKEFIVKFATIYYCFATFFALAVSLYAKEFLMFMARDPSFWPGWVIIPLAVFSWIQHGLGYFLSQGLVMTNKSIQISILILITALLNITLNIILIPLWGLLGAASATLTAYLFWNMTRIYFSKKYYNLNFELKRLAHITFIAIALYLISLSFTGEHILICKLFILLCYPTTLFITKFFKNHEILFIQNLFVKVRGAA